MESNAPWDFKNGINKRLKTALANGAVQNGTVFDSVYLLSNSSFKQQKIIFFLQRNNFYFNFLFSNFYFVSIFFQFLNFFTLKSDINHLKMA
jgi:hypothetical protein